MKKNILIMMVISLAMAVSASAFTIESPEETTYNSTILGLDIEHNESLESISYKVNDDDWVLACENCSDYSEELNLSEGEQTILAEGILGNMTFNDSVTFTIEIPEINETDDNDTEVIDFSLEIIDPEAKTYDDGDIDVEIESNETLDEISFSIGNYSVSCENCSELEDELDLEEGNYTLEAEGTLGNITKELSVEFVIEFEVNDTDDNDTDVNDTDDDSGNESDGEPRFALGYNKLPKAVEAGEVSDEELAEIIRNNELNPGILNRLIKTGMLGNESLEAILDTKHKPAGIFRKMFSFLGVKQDTYAENIYENYELPKKLEQKIVSREDLPNKYKNKVKKKLQDGELERVREQQQKPEIPPGQAKKALGVGSQEARHEKCEGENEDCDEEPKNLKDGSGKDKVPPGQAKKSGSGNSKVKTTGNVARGRNK